MKIVILGIGNKTMRIKANHICHIAFDKQNRCFNKTGDNANLSQSHTFVPGRLLPGPLRVTLSGPSEEKLINLDYLRMIRLNLL